MKQIQILGCALFWLGFLANNYVRAAEVPSNSAPFTAAKASANFSLPPIVIQYDPTSKTGANWAEISHPIWSDYTPTTTIGRAANYLQEGLDRLTGKKFRVVSSNDLSEGFVLTLLKDASPDIRNDPEIQRALKSNGGNNYDANEAFYLRSEKERLLIVANTPDGLSDAVSELLESVGYEILGMGPDWIYAPNYKDKALTFNINKTDHPSFYIRSLAAHSGQDYGFGTIYTGLTDPVDENVDVSNARWMIGTRMWGKSMAVFPGHALLYYHRKVMDRMRQTGTTQGFYARVGVGPEVSRPAADATLTGHWWMNSDPKGSPGFEKIYLCDGKGWNLHPPSEYFGAKVDVSVPYVREIIFEDMKQKATDAFKAHPDDPVIFPTEVEDGGLDEDDRYETTAYKNWYPDYLAQEKLPFGRPYGLNGYRGLSQPYEIWDPYSGSDHAFALADFLLHEFDKWIDSLPREQQITSTGKSKKALIRCSFLSYGYNDVPPDFNPDQRIRICVAPFPKHRGVGKWEKIYSAVDDAKALHILLPAEPSADYLLYSFSFYYDGGPLGIPAQWNASPASLSEFYHEAYGAGIRAITAETDFNFGKYGLGYYLISKLLWNIRLTTSDLDQVRDRWLQRSFGSAWKEMKAYYDFVLPDNYPINTPNTWAKAIRLIDAADKKLAESPDPDAQRRIDDVKQYWYFHYLFDSGKYTFSSPEVIEYLWKGQMSYMVGMEGLLGSEYKNFYVANVVGPKISGGPAHYTHEETQGWWSKILDFWKVTPVTIFADGKLSDGKPAKNVDLNDLVQVKDFQGGPVDGPFLYDGGSMKPRQFLVAAERENQLVGFKLIWPYIPHDNDYAPKKVSYGAEIWNPTQKVWVPWIDKNTTEQSSVEIVTPKNEKLEVVTVQHKALRPGVYRFTVGYCGNLSLLASLAYDPVSCTYVKPQNFTYSTNADGLTQSGVYFYIPKGTKSLDMDIWDDTKIKFLTLYKGLPSKHMVPSRKIDISGMGAHVLPLNPGEDGSFALLEGNLFCFPFLYSIPTLWAKSPSVLLIPRSIAEADGLSIISPAQHEN